MKCKHCGREIVRIQTMTGPAVCEAAPVTYWSMRDGDAVGLLTPNGESVYGNLTGDLQKAVGVGYLPHFCHHYTVLYRGRDSWSRPVYESPDGTLYVDVDPRRDRDPDICTKQFNTFDGEPCDSVDGFFTFIPHRDIW